MLKIIISPAKKMNVRNDILSYKNIPFFINEAQTLFSYMKNMSLEELKTYAQAKSVHDFYYTESVSLNASSIEAVSTSSDTTDTAPADTSQEHGFPQQGRALAVCNIRGISP